MTKDWQKFIEKHPGKDVIFSIVKDISQNTLSSYEVKKLAGYRNWYRIRKGNIRIVFEKNDDENLIIAVDTRGQIYDLIKHK